MVTDGNTPNIDSSGQTVTGAEKDMVESRAFLHGIISSAMDAIISVDERQTIRIFNAAAEKMFRTTSEQVLGKPLEILIPERFRKSHREHVHAFGSTGVTMRAMGWLQPLSALRADGEEFPIEASISQVELNGHKIYTVILRDITARNAAEEQIRRMTAELEHRVRERTEALEMANREMESFIYTVAHDLRAPLRHMDAFSRILVDDFSEQLPNEAKQYLATIGRSSRVLSQLVDDLLKLAKIGQSEVARELTPLEPLLQSAIADLRAETQGRRIEWRIQSLPTVRCDPRLVKQIFLNLLSNAVKYTRPREVAQIEVGTAEYDGQPAVFVRDNGVGFDMKYADKLFMVFHRLHRADEFEGTGVGLATVDLIVRKHKGNVWGEGIPDRGATFYFTIPDQAPKGPEKNHESVIEPRAQPRCPVHRAGDSGPPG